MRAKGNDKISYLAEVHHPAREVVADGCACVNDGVVNVVGINGALCVDKSSK
jgi:hypothetical protein